MTNDPREQHIKRILEGVDGGHDSTEHHAARAVEAVRRATTTTVITRLDEQNRLDEMLSNMLAHFKGRDLKDISTPELMQIAGDSVDETLGIAPLQREDQVFPEPMVSDLTPEGRALQLMRQIAEVVEGWKHGGITPLDAAVSVEELLHGRGRSGH